MNEIIWSDPISHHFPAEKKLGADQSWQAWVTDPNGVRIEFHQYTEQSMQLRGGNCMVNWKGSCIWQCKDNPNS